MSNEPTNHEHEPMNDDPDAVTNQERVDFLNRQGWAKATPDERAVLEATWSDGIIRMAIDLNLA